MSCMGLRHEAVQTEGYVTLNPWSTFKSEPLKAVIKAAHQAFPFPLTCSMCLVYVRVLAGHQMAEQLWKQGGGGSGGV